MQKVSMAILAGLAVLSAYGVQATETAIFDSPDMSTEHILGGTDPDTQTCGGGAPADTFCTTGAVDIEQPLPDALNRAFIPQHMRNGFVSHGFSGVTLTGVTATLESKLVHAQGARVFRCNVVNGAIGCMPGSGTFPADQTLFAHECRSYNLGTTTPGGTGNWACSIFHPGL